MDKKETTAGCSQPSPDKTTDSVISVEDLMRETTSFRTEIKQTNLDVIPSIESELDRIDEIGKNIELLWLLRTRQRNQ